MFSEVAEIALVAARLGQFQQLLKTQVISILNFSRPHAIAYTRTQWGMAEPACFTMISFKKLVKTLFNLVDRASGTSIKWLIILVLLDRILGLKDNSL